MKDVPWKGEVVRFDSSLFAFGVSVWSDEDTRCGVPWGSAVVFENRYDNLFAFNESAVRKG